MSAAPDNIAELEKRTGVNVPPTEPAFKLYTLDEFVQCPKVSSYVRGILPANAIVVVFGPPKEGKTFSVTDLTMHAAHGLPDWHGCAIRRAQKVAYLCGEGASGLRVRLKAWLEHHDTIEKSDNFRVFPYALPLPESVTQITETHLRPFGPNIVVTDTANSYFGAGDENSTQDMTAFCDAVKYLRDQLDCTVVVIHHTGHGDQSRERGSIVLRATADVLVHVAKDSKDKTLVGFQVINARDIETMEQAIGLKLVRYETDWLDEDGEPLVTCIVQGTDQSVTLPSRGKGPRPLGRQQKEVLAIIQELAKGQPVEPSGEIILMRHEVAARAKQKDIPRQSVSSAWTPLATAGYLRLVEPGFVYVKARP